jgi:hypothetical protein
MFWIEGPDLKPHRSSDIQQLDACDRAVWRR